MYIHRAGYWLDKEDFISDRIIQSTVISHELDGGNELHWPELMISYHAPYPAGTFWQSLIFRR